MQRSSQIDEPDYGHLFDDMMIADGAKIPHENYCRPRVEIELAFIMGRPLKGPGVGLAEVLRATEYVVPAIEIVDARLQDPAAGSSTRWRTMARRRALSSAAGRSSRSTSTCAGSAASCTRIRRSRRPASPPVCSAIPRLAWPGSPTSSPPTGCARGSHLVLAGSFTRVVLAHKGDTLHADFGALGGIAVQFV